MLKLKGILACAAVMAVALSGINALIYRLTSEQYGFAAVAYFVIGAVVGVIVSLTDHTRPVRSAVVTMVALWAAFVLAEFGHSGVDVDRLIGFTLALSGAAVLGGFGYKLAARDQSEDDDQ